MRRKTVQQPPLTLAERYNAASAELGAALSVFESVASQLVQADQAYTDVADECQQEIERLLTIKSAAKEGSERATRVAQNILELTRSNYDRS